MQEVLKTAFSFDFFGISDVGLVREQNEDVWEVLPEKGVFIIADGMGGHNAGEVAAALAVSSLPPLLEKKDKSDPSTCLKQVFEEANSIVYKKGRSDDALYGMGTTLLTLWFCEEKAFYCHVGDSRLFLLRQNMLVQLTEDHTLINELNALGATRKGSTTPFKNVLTKAIGTHPRVEPTIDSCVVEAEDLFLLSTDGLTNYVSHNDIEEILNQKKSLEQKGHLLVDLAKKHGGGDNITLILVKIHDLSR